MLIHYLLPNWEEGRWIGTAEAAYHTIFTFYSLWDCVRAWMIMALLSDQRF